MKEKRNGFIDLVKFLGSLSIAAGHWYSVWPQMIDGQAFSDGFLRFWGVRLNAMVALFFVISGYYAAKSFPSLSEGRQSCGSWILRRIRRLLPPYILSLLAFSIADILNWMRAGSWWLGRKWTFSGLVLTALGINSFAAESVNGINSPAWFVGVLLFNNMVFALVASSGMKRKTKTACFLAMIFLGMSCMGGGIAIPLLSEKVSRSYMSFFTGTMLGLYLKPEKSQRSFPAAEILALLVTAVISFLTGGLYGTGLAGDKIILYTFVVGPALIRLGENAFLQKALSHRVTAFLGAISFDIYLFHMPVYVGIACIFGGSIRYESVSVLLPAAIAVIACSFLVWMATPLLEALFDRSLKAVGIDFE